MISLSKLTSDEYVHCPSCGDECGLHIVDITVNAGGQITRINDLGLHHGGGDPDGRGTSIEVFYACENCGEVTSVKQHFQKGMVSLSSKLLEKHGMEGEVPKDPHDWGGYRDIWRD